ncbi:ISNCY family transposase [Elusimicrobiota bacterium]
MEEKLTMSNRDIDRLRVIRNVLNKQLTWSQAASQLDLSDRQIGRLCASVRQEGNKGIVHGLRGRPSNNQIEPGLIDSAIGFVKAHYDDFGPTFANEKLRKNHSLTLSISCLRQAMIDEGIWKAKKPKIRHRAWRQRRSCLGEMAQLDGSDHDWFEGRGPRCALVIYIDDATSRILYGEFVSVEDTMNLMRTTKTYLKLYGRPIVVYVDKDSIYKINRQATVEEELRDSNPLTQFARAMEELGVELIYAHSPQAKGRVERSFKTHQDRLVKELRLAGICTMQEANRFLRDVYIPQHNASFAVEPASRANAHRPLLKTHDLEEILCLRTSRTLLNDFTLRFDNHFYQVTGKQPVRVRPGSKVFIEIRLDGSTHLKFKGHYLDFKPIAKPAFVSGVSRISKQANSPQIKLRAKTPRPPSDHPWKTLSHKSRIRKRSLAMLRRIKLHNHPSNAILGRSAQSQERPFDLDQQMGTTT